MKKITLFLALVLTLVGVPAFAAPGHGPAGPGGPGGPHAMGPRRPAVHTRAYVHHGRRPVAHRTYYRYTPRYTRFSGISIIIR